MKRIYLLTFLLTSFAFSHTALATSIYAGGGVGYGRINTPNKNVFDVSEDPAGSTSHTQGGVSGRVFAGTILVDYFGLEVGYTRYARSYYRANEPSFILNSSLAYYVHSYDLVAKGYLPLARSGFAIYALAGASRVSQTVKFDNEEIPLNGQVAQPNNGSTHIYKTLPIYGLGVAYQFGNNLTANVEFTQVHYSGHINNDTHAVPNLNLATVNLAYHFC